MVPMAQAGVFMTRFRHRRVGWFVVLLNDRNSYNAWLAAPKTPKYRDDANPDGRMTSLDLDLSDVLARLLFAATAGGLVGLNRDLADKPIGVRTLGLVSLGAATVAVAGMQVQGIAENPDALSRVVQGVIQGVMAGISFIGAGVILRNVETRNVEGLTTAATVWVASALGVACGLGAWRTMAIAIPVTLAILFATGWIDRFTKRNRNGDGQ